MRSDRLARLHAAVDRQEGEQIQVVPLGPPVYGGEGAPDPARPAATLTAAVAAIPRITRTSGSGASTGHNAEVLTATHTALFTASALPYAVRKDDRVVLLQQGGIETIVNSASPFGTGRVLLRLQAIGPS